MLSLITSEIPSSSRDLAITNKEYYKNSSSITLIWNHPDEQSQAALVDYYQLMIELNEGSKINSTLFTEFVYVYNSTDTMATVSILPYDSNVSLSLTAHNCIGDSAAVTIDYIAGKCMPA